MYVQTIDSYRVEAEYSHTTKGWNNRDYYKVTLILPTGETLFGKDTDTISPSPLHASADDILELAWVFVTLRPGDTDLEFFENDTSEEMSWRKSAECEYLACELQEGE